MDTLRIILAKPHLIFEHQSSGKKYFFSENYPDEASGLVPLATKYLNKLFQTPPQMLGNSFIRALISLEKLEDRLIEVKNDGSWKRINDLNIYREIREQSMKSPGSDYFRNNTPKADTRPIDDEEVKPLEISLSMIKDMERYTENHPDDPEGFYKLGVAYLEGGKYQEAADNFRESLSLNSEESRYYFQLSRTYELMGNLDLALSEIKEAYQRNKDNPEILLRMGLILYQQGKFREAVPCFHEAISFNPFYVPAYVELGKVYNQLEYYEEAIYVLEEALSLEPNNESAWRNLRVAEGIRKKRQSTELNNLGIAYAEKNKLDKAIEKFQKAIEIFPDDSEFHFNLAYAYYQLENFDSAIVSFKNALRLSPNLAEAHLYLGEIHALKKHYSEAKSAFNLFLQLNPTGEQAEKIRAKISSF